ncbi:8-oxo-dGTP pyrophosphatase MutT (NUDIX family) [Kineosphaera limosa]|nr:8-oxo-dGTP pyrophosphatase MutT (NUDIX family) [Kineosphaera limosa]
MRHGESGSPGGPALALLRSWVAPDAGQERLRRDYVAHLEAHPQGWARSGPPQHLTVGAVVLDATGSRTLLVLHGKAKRWYQPGGHVEAGDADLAAAALREAREETGLADLRLDPDPVHLDRHPLPGAFACDEHLDVRFLAVAPVPERAQRSAESDDLRWWPVERLPEPSVEALVAAGRARLRASLGNTPGGRS